MDTLKKKNIILNTLIRKTLLVALFAFGGIFLVANVSKAGCVDESKCCRCYSGYIGEDVASYSTKYLSEADASSENTCSIACARTWPDATYYRYGESLAFKDINRSGPEGSLMTADQPTSGGGTTGTETIPGSTESGGLIQCGRGGQRMCTLCDIIVGLNLIIKYIFRIAIALGVFGFAIAGVMYIVSAGDSSATTNAKGVMKNTTIGIIVVLSAWLIINYSMMLLGAKQNATGQNTLGLNIKGWGEFECVAKPR